MRLFGNWNVLDLFNVCVYFGMVKLTGFVTVEFYVYVDVRVCSLINSSKVVIGEGKLFIDKFELYFEREDVLLSL